MTYPDGIDALVNVNANDTLAAGGHAARHNSVNTALVEVKDYLVGALGSKLPFSFGTATPTTTESGFLWYDSNSTPAATKFWDGSAFVPFGGKILQVVRATDSTNRSTTSATFQDAGISVTIAPTKSDSAILFIFTARYAVTTTTVDPFGSVQITDASNNAISGAQEILFGLSYNSTNITPRNGLVMFGYATPGTTSSITHKIRYRAETSNVTFFLQNAANTAQFYAIEVSA
jgi:hypothetical protein